jgi:RHS repeat-associated protein
MMPRMKTIPWQYKIERLKFMMNKYLPLALFVVMVGMVHILCGVGNASAQQTLVHDENGNLISKTDATGTTTYTYDARNRLIALSGPGVTATFTYDALGRRNSKTVNGVSTQHLNDGGDIVQEIGGGAVGATYLRGLNVDEPFVRQSSGAEYYHTDALGSVLALSNSSGVSATSYAYEPFGKNSVNGASANPFQFTGRENDGTGLYYYRARYYSPQLQRFLTEDPLEFAGGDVNLYSYVWNSPTNYTDQFGLAVMYPGPIPPGCEPLGQRKSFTQRFLHNIGCASNFLPAGGMVVGGRAAGGAARTLDELSNAARAADRNDLTKAGRSLQKHSDRTGAAFEASSKKASDLNRQGQDVVDDILTNPGSVRRPNRLGGEDMIAPDGRGVRYNSDGTFRSFLEPK